MVKDTLDTLLEPFARGELPAHDELDTASDGSFVGVLGDHESHDGPRGHDDLGFLVRYVFVELA